MVQQQKKVYSCLSLTFFRDTRPLLHAAAPVCSCCTYFQLFLQAFVRPPSTTILRFALKRNTPDYTDTTGGMRIASWLPLHDSCYACFCLCTGPWSLTCFINLPQQTLKELLMLLHVASQDLICGSGFEKYLLYLRDCCIYYRNSRNKVNKI